MFEIFNNIASNINLFRIKGKYFVLKTILNNNLKNSFYRLNVFFFLLHKLIIVLSTDTNPVTLNLFVVKIK